MEQMPIFRVHYQNLERYIEKVYRVPDFDFFIATGVTHGEVPEYKVDGLLPTNEWIRRADDLRCGRRTRSVTLILNTLAKDKYIPLGTYLIDTKKLADPVHVYTKMLEQVRDPLHPELLVYKEKHKGNQVFRERSAILDKALVERLNA